MIPVISAFFDMGIRARELRNRGSASRQEIVARMKKAKAGVACLPPRLSVPGLTDSARPLTGIGLRFRAVVDQESIARLFQGAFEVEQAKLLDQAIGIPRQDDAPVPCADLVLSQFVRVIEETGGAVVEQGVVETRQ